MIIDVHNHPDYYGYHPAKFLANMDQFGIDYTCLLSWEAPVNDYDPSYKNCECPFNDVPTPFDRCVAYRDRAPDRFLLGFCPDPRRPDAVGRLRSATDLFDVNLCGELKLRMMYDNPDAVRLYRVCGELGLPVLMHFDYELPRAESYPWPNFWYGGGIDALERVLKLCPETRFIGHAPGFWAHISRDDRYLTEGYPKGKVIPGGRIEELLEKHPNLYCEISAGSGHNALSRDPDFSRGFLTRWQDRVLYGRDYYDNIHQELLNSLGLPREILDKIYAGNALKILRGVERLREEYENGGKGTKEP